MSYVCGSTDWSFHAVFQNLTEFISKNSLFSIYLEYDCSVKMLWGEGIGRKKTLLLLFKLGCIQISF